MKIIVLSDTHSRSLPPQVRKELPKADLIIHAGDICDTKMLGEIEQINDVEAVYGNMDDQVLRKKLPRRLILKYDGVCIGVLHGEGSPEHLIDHIKDEFKDEDVDVIIFGHSHEPFNKKIDGVVFFNPGSPNDEIFAPYCSYGVIKIEGNSVKTKIVRVK
ncbi:MAG: metallophosphoesterase [Candidatus Omnitrophota bacterium]